MIPFPKFEDFTAYFGDSVWTNGAKEILTRHKIPFSSLSRAAQGENIVFFVDRRYILKIYTPLKRGFQKETAALSFASGKMRIPIPEIVQTGEIEGYKYLITNQFEGELITRQSWLAMSKSEQMSLLSVLASELKTLHSYSAIQFDFDWPGFIQTQIDTALEKQRREGGNPEWLESIPVYFEKHLPLLPKKPFQSFQHGDVHFGNLRLRRKNGKIEICGLFDFADSIKGFHEYEFIAIGVLMIQGQADLQREFFRSYGYPNSEINEALRHRMFLLTMLYEYSSLRRYAERLGVNPMEYSLEDLGRAIWNFA